MEAPEEASEEEEETEEEDERKMDEMKEMSRLERASARGLLHLLLPFPRSEDDIEGQTNEILFSLFDSSSSACFVTTTSGFRS